MAELRTVAWPGIALQPRLHLWVQAQFRQRGCYAKEDDIRPFGAFGTSKNTPTMVEIGPAPTLGDAWPGAWVAVMSLTSTRCSTTAPSRAARFAPRCRQGVDFIQE